MICSTCQSPNPEGAPRCRACGSPLSGSSLSPGTTENTINPDAPDALPPGTLLGGLYEIERVLGQGGFGITYACHDTLLQRKVAVKEFFPFGCRRDASQVMPSRAISPQDFTSAREKFLDEARVLAGCSHRGIVAVHTAFSENNTAYMVMELLHGQTLAAVLAQRGGRLPEDEAVTLAEAICDALGYVHDRGLLHRDLKPENVMLCDDGRVMLIDFGTAREYSKGHLQVRGHTVVVTPGYAPLEQYAQQARRGPYTDLYALCALLYHLLTGQVPVAASDRAVGVLLSPLRELNPRVSRRVARAVESGLHIEVDKRPQSVSEFLNLLHREVEESRSNTGWEAPLPLEAEMQRIRREDAAKRARRGAPDVLSDDDVTYRYLSSAEASDSSAPIGAVINASQTWTPHLAIYDNALQAQYELPDGASAVSSSASQSNAPQSSANAPQPSTQHAPPAALGAATSAPNPAAAALHSSLLHAVPGDAHGISPATAAVGKSATQPKSSQVPADVGGVAHCSAQSTLTETDKWIQKVVIILFLLAGWLTIRFFAPSQPRPFPEYQADTSLDFSQNSTAFQYPTPDPQLVARRQQYHQELMAQTRRERESTLNGPFVALPESVKLPHFHGVGRGSAFSPDNRVLAYLSQNGPLVFWDLEKRKTLRTLKLPGLRRFQFSPDGKHLAASLGGDMVAVYNAQNGKQLKTLTFVPQEYSRSIYFSSNDWMQMFAYRQTAELDIRQPVVTQWNWRAGSYQAYTIPTNISRHEPVGVALHPREAILAVGSQGDSLLEYNWKKQKLERSVRLSPRHKDQIFRGVVNGLRYSVDGSMLAVTQNSNDIRLLDKNRNVRWHNIAPLSSEPLFTRPVLRFSPSGKWLAVCQAGVRLYDTRTGQLVQYFSRTPYFDAKASRELLAFSHDEKRLYMLEEQVLNSWRLKTPAEIAAQIPTTPIAGKTAAAPAELVQAYQKWKTAHAASNSENLLQFYTPDARWNGYFGNMTRADFTHLLRANPGRNWKGVKDNEPPHLFHAADGYLMRAQLNYVNGWRMIKASGERRLLWVRRGGRWLVAVDTLEPYRDVVWQNESPAN